MDSAEPVTAAEPEDISTNDKPSDSHSMDAPGVRARIIPFARITKPRLDVPRLNISDDLERNTFVGVLVGVGAVIWLGEYYNLVGTLEALILAMSAIAAYGLLCFFGREQRVRLDRAGDNCYYLGLTYTLISLSVALVKRQVGAAPDELIETFGIAVGSTIVGVIARLLLIQFRLEPDDIEARARVELAAAADNLKKQLIHAAARFQSFSVSIQDSVSKAVNKVTDDQIARQKELVEEINAVLAKSIAAIAQSTTTIEESLKQHSAVMRRYQSAAEKSATAADIFAEKMAAIAIPNDLLKQNFNELRGSLSEITSKLDLAAQSVTASSSNMSTAAVNLSQLAAQSSHATAALSSSADAAGKLKDSVESMAASLNREATRLSSGNSSLEGEVNRMKSLSLEYARGLSEVAQFLAKEIGRA